MKKFLLSTLLLFLAATVFSQKQVYIPAFITNTGMDLNNCSSQWCYSRSVQTDNIVVFWEAGFGSDPSTAAGAYRVNMTNLLAVAERSYSMYLDSLKFAIKGSSVTDRYKLMIFLLYSTDWAAYGSGQDNRVGTLHVNPAAANGNTVLAHEIGHCFQYITGCDSPLGGWRYGFGANGSGGNGFWEQCANWMAFKTYPAQQFTAGDFRNYIRNNHKHIIHETPRYANYFVQDYWTYKRGKEFMGRLWRDSRRPEDPIEAYKRLNSLNQSQFNDEMYEHASRLTTWDLPAIRSYGANYIDSRAQVAMNLTADNYWMVDPSVCIENYGYNSIKLNAPAQATTVTVRFRGKAGESGFRALNVNQGGWRYGFVALLTNGTRVYSTMGTANVTNGVNPEQTLTFNCPANCSKLWLVVSGSPQEHWRHAWDDNDANDEHWPYQVQFTNTNLLGRFSTPIRNETLTYNITVDPMTSYTPTPVTLNSNLISEAFAMSPADIAAAMGSSIIYNGLNPDGSLNPTSTANAPGHWFTNTGQTIAYGASAYLYSELNMNTMVANIGQYPSRCVPGQTYTIKQALVYTKSPTESARVTLIFNVTIRSSNGVPTDLNLSATSVNENVAGNTVVGTLSSTDPDAGNTFTYTLVSGTGSTDNASFNISGGSLRITNSPNFEVKNSYSIRVRTTDQGGLTHEEAFVITINNVNESPSDISLSAASINENVAGNTLVGTLSSTDPDAGNTFTYTLVSGTGSTDNASFNISGGSLRITNSPNFEVKNSYSIRVRTTDQGGLTHEEAFVITINNVNESPSDISLSESSINENVASNSVVGILNSTDPDAGSTFTYSLVAGAGDTDNTSFSISGNSLRITTIPDFEIKSSYTIRVRTTDQNNQTYEESFTIIVNDLIETGVAKAYANSQINIYPNPSMGKMTIHADGLSLNDYKIRVTNVLGETVFADQYTEQLDLQQLPKGVYYLILEDDKGTFVKQVIMQ